MNSVIRCFGSAVVILTAFTATSNLVSAQALQDIEDAIIENNQIEDALRRDRDLSQKVDLEDNQIDGETGVFVVRRNDIFYVAGAGSYGYSSNAARTFDNDGGSFSQQFALSGGVQTKLGGVVDFGANLGVSGVSYDEDFAPSSRNVNGGVSIGAAIPKTPLYVEANFNAGRLYDGDFESPTKYHAYGGRLSAILRPAKRLVIEPYAAYYRQKNELSENNGKVFSAGARISYYASGKLSFHNDVTYAETRYDNFYEDVTFVERKDKDYVLRTNINYRISDNFSLNLSGGYTKRNSTFFLSEYCNYETALTLTARMTF